jgi:hypothetical protein
MAMFASPSLILEAPSIAMVRIDAASTGPWRSAEPNQRRRMVKLDLTVEQVFKGRLHPGERIHIDAEQHEAIGRYVAVGGAWSGKVVEKGRQYLVFSRQPAETLRVADAGEAVDVELALEFEKNGWPLSELDRRAGPNRGSLGRLFAEYLGAKLPAAVRGGAGQWESILAFIEGPELSPAFRAMGAVTAMDAVLMQPPAPPPILQRTALMGFHLLAMPDANGLHNRLVQAYLPNLLGLTGSEPKHPAAEIFSGNPAAREQAAKSLAALPPSAHRDRLQAWLEAR